MSLRVAVIGCGPIGNRHADLYQADPLAELVAVCDIRKDRCDTAAQRLGVPGFYDAPTMLATIKPDLVSVATGGVEYGSDHYLPPSRHPHGTTSSAKTYLQFPEAEKMVACAKNTAASPSLHHRFTDAAKVAKWVDERSSATSFQLFHRGSRTNESRLSTDQGPQSTRGRHAHFGGDICAVHAFCTTARPPSTPP